MSLHSQYPSNVSSSTAVSSASSSASSSRISLNADDEENVTITAKRSIMLKAKRKSQDDLRILAISTNITELSYSISDIQTRIFEIQELRHKSQSSGDSGITTSIIDKSLMSLDERLEVVAEGMKAVNDSVEQFLQASSTPVVSEGEALTEEALLMRKHATLVAEWEAVQDESDVLREELKEDKWLTVFRTVTEQADGMMSSLEKAVNRCQDFIWQVHHRAGDDSASRSSFTNSLHSEKSSPTLELFNSLLESFEAKKKHYMPATSKVLSIIDKGVQDRVTKNGETLRRHAESAKRWRNLKDRIARTDAEMEKARKILTTGDMTPSETGSSASGATSKHQYLATPPSGSRSKSRAPSRAMSASSSISRSMSPLRRFARKITGAKSPAIVATPLPLSREPSREPASQPIKTLRRQRTALFSFRESPPSPVTPERGHKYSHSFTPESSPGSKRLEATSAVKTKPAKQRWNSSTKVEPEDRISTVKQAPLKRPTASAVVSQAEDVPPVPHIPPAGRRSVSRSSMASSRPWSPITSSISTAPSSNPPSVPPLPSSTRPPSRCQTPSMSQSPRPRPKTPSHIPVPALHWHSLRQNEPDDSEADVTTLMQRAFSPTQSTSASSVHMRSPSGSKIIPPRPPSRSMIPLPSFQISSASRPSSAMSNHLPDSPSTSSFNVSVRAQTPESVLQAMTQQIPFYHASALPRTSARPTVQNKLPPSSFRDASTTRTPGSRPSSRAGAYTPSLDQNPITQYIPANPKDPLDAEVANIVNSVAHGLLVERVDPPLRTIPPEGEEIRAQYAFSNSLSRKVVTCRLTTMTRSGPRTTAHDKSSKKVMCRVGGGWQDLQLYMLNRQAGL